MTDDIVISVCFSEWKTWLAISETTSSKPSVKRCRKRARINHHRSFGFNGGRNHYKRFGIFWLYFKTCWCWNWFILFNYVLFIFSLSIWHILTRSHPNWSHQFKIYRFSEMIRISCKWIEMRRFRWHIRKRWVISMIDTRTCVNRLHSFTFFSVTCQLKINTPWKLHIACWKRNSHPDVPIRPIGRNAVFNWHFAEELPN